LSTADHVRSIVLLVIPVVIVSIYGFAVACRTQARLSFEDLVSDELLCNFCDLAYCRLCEDDASCLDDLAVIEDDILRPTAFEIA